MFRTNEVLKINPDLEQDDLDQFSGATLKISNDENSELSSLRNRNCNTTTNNVKSAILSGSSSPILENSKYNNCIGKEEFPDDRFNVGKPANDEPIGCPGEYFSFRSGQFEKAVNEAVNLLLRPANDTDILGSWLLTDVSHWDHERERVFILTTKTFIIIKYDFIALKILQHNKIRLDQIDTVLRGKLTYPQTSLVPRIEGITNGVSSIICGNLLSNRFFGQKTTTVSSTKPISTNVPKLTIAPRFDFSHFRPIERKDLGIRILWNRGQSLPLLSSWNPFAVDIPWATVKDHPIYACQDPKATVQAQEDFEKIRYTYCVESLYNALLSVFATSNPNSVNFNCCFEDGPILMENYVGIGAVIHNKNNFGFFKCRGKFSF